MAYKRKTWKNDSSTPLNADGLNDFDKRVGDAVGGIENDINSNVRKTAMEKGLLSDLNDGRETGIYITNANTKNTPPTSEYGGVALVLNRDTTTLVQIHIDVSSSANMMSRALFSNGRWGSWK